MSNPHLKLGHGESKSIFEQKPTSDLALPERVLVAQLVIESVKSLFNASSGQIDGKYNRNTSQAPVPAHVA